MLMEARTRSEGKHVWSLWSAVEGRLGSCRVGVLRKGTAAGEILSVTVPTVRRQAV
jgi:hypothetical protein